MISKQNDVESRVVVQSSKIENGRLVLALNATEVSGFGAIKNGFASMLIEKIVINYVPS